MLLEICMVVILAIMCSKWTLGGNGRITIADKIFAKKKLMEKRVDLTRQVNNPERASNIYKDMLNGMKKSVFRWYATAGTERSRKILDEPSRGTKKLEEIIRRTGLKPRGGVLSLCAGRGGWDYLMSRFPAVEQILSITLGAGPGHEGHEDYSVSNWRGKEKITQLNADVRKLPANVAEHFDFVLFDGGESHGDYGREAARFTELLSNGCLKYLLKHHDFVIKILTPSHLEVIRMLEDVRKLTGKGNYVLLDSSKNSNQEMYFVSTQARGSLVQQAHDGLLRRITRATNETEKTRGPPLEYGIDAKIDYSDSIGELGRPVHGNKLRFKHWMDLGTFPFGIGGTDKTQTVTSIWNLIRHVAGQFHGFSEWSATNTTPAGFMKTFQKKIDKSPVENSKYHGRMKRVYEAMAKYYRKHGINGGTMGTEEILEQANRQGAAGRQDIRWKNVGEFLDDPERDLIMKHYEERLLAGKPLGAVFNTMGKREKKRGGKKTGSRMVAFLPIVMRMLELKYLGRALEFVKPAINKCTVGGLGLHDFGMAVNEQLQRGEYSVCLDIAGWDTRMSATQLEMERDFFITVGFDPKMTTRLYEIYTNPLIMINVDDEDHVRTKLLAGKGQRMSGSIITYAGNTISTLALAITAWTESNNIDDVDGFVDDLFSGTADIGMLSSGDDHFVCGSFENMKKFSKCWNIYNDLGFVRKDIGLENDSRIGRGITNVDFCSHRYTKVIYRGVGGTATRYQATRDYGEIFGKACIWISGETSGLSQRAWAAAQAANLLLNYHHMRDCRRIAFAIRGVIPRNLVFTGMGAKFLNKPWLQSGEIMEILNRNLFGEGTAYPVDFRLDDLSGLGYMELRRETTYNVNFFHDSMIWWRKQIPALARSGSRDHGGDGRLEGMYRYLS